MNEKKSRIEYLVAFLNKCCDEYYNGFTPTLSDAEYDALFDELTLLEKETEIILPNSPTQRAGYEVLSELKKVAHPAQLLSLAKTKSAAEVYAMSSVSDGYLGLKMDGLTVKLVYKNGLLSEASTRGDGNVGEIITHTARTFVNIPKSLPIKSDITVTGEAYIDIPTFERINDSIENDEDKFSTPRNLAAGSVRQLDSSVCAARGVKFMPFGVIDGMETEASKSKRLDILHSYGFDRLPSFYIKKEDTAEYVEKKIFELKSIAENKGLPIDGIVFTYDNSEFSKSLGKTSHHYRDGIAFKFGDPTAESILKNIIWNISRTGQLTPIAEFAPVNIDNTTVERASLHNITFIRNLKLHKGDSILVSKRNMIIPHVEKNLSVPDEENYIPDYPEKCPICHNVTTVETTDSDEKTVEVLYCKNPDCPGKQIKKFTHFVSKPAMNIDGLSEATITKFVQNGWISSLKDIYALNTHKSEIASMDGFGQKSADNLITAIENSKDTSLSNFLVALNIGLLGKSAARIIETAFSGDPDKLLAKIRNGYDFTALEGFGEIMNEEIRKWFENEENVREYEELSSLLFFRKIDAETIDENNMFFGKTIVITGTFSKYTRDELTEILTKSGAKVTGSVSKKTDFVLCGENAGSKLSKAEQLGVRVIKEEELEL